MLNRRQLLQSAAAAAPALLLTRAAANAQSGPSAAGKNVVLFITDQERAIQHFPRGWAERNLPGLTRLQANGITFENAFSNACMCSPARSTLLTGYYPAQHGVKYTLEEDMPDDQYPQVPLPTDFKNIGTVMRAAGYDVVYKGKWHLSKPANGQFTPEDVAKYGFGRWNPPDAGANQDIPQEGGGVYDNDGRYMTGTGDAAAGQEGVLQYLTTQAAHNQPFFLVVSLVNPHDVLMYPRNLEAAGYDASWLEGEIELPATVHEDLRDKPVAQRSFRRIMALSGRLKDDEMKRNYLNFYANLMKLVDGYLVDVLDTLAQTGLLDDTIVIRTSDHGEMGMAHGGLRQKNFNAYEETLRVPLVYSNPKLFPTPKRSDALVSHVDFLPTIASLLGAPQSARADWQGVDYSHLILGQSTAPVQDSIVFTYDDFQAGQARGPYVRQPNHIVSLREKRYKIARYWDPSGKEKAQWEMYDLRRDPLERHNIAAPGYKRNEREQRELRRLKRRLAKVTRERLKPLPNTPQPKVAVAA
jgi:choline-sulfatase